MIPKKKKNIVEKTALFLPLFLILTFTSKGQYQTLVADSFQTENEFTDVSKILLWGNQTNPVSAFSRLQKSDDFGLTFPCLTTTDSALTYGSGYTAVNSLKTCTAIDYRFPKLTRNNDSLIIEFDALWDSLIQIGEGGRMVVALLYDYPSQGLEFGSVDSINKTAPFGRPAYNIRILNRAGNAGSGGNTAPGYFFYGGGMDALGEFEKTALWWLPGFIAQPGGNSPQTGPAYPNGPTTKVFSTMASQERWMHFTLKFFPESFELWIRKSADPAGMNQKLTTVKLPKTSQGIPWAVNQLNQFYNTSISNTPLFYRWSPDIDAVRFYFRSNNRSYLANVKMGWSGSLTTKRQDLRLKNNEIYPNPAPNGQFWTTVEEPEFFWVYDLCGRLVASGKVEKQKIDLRELKPGPYSILIYQKTEKQLKRFPIIIE